MTECNQSSFGFEGYRFAVSHSNDDGNTQFLTWEKAEVDGLLGAPDRSSEQGRRDYALLLFLYHSGARATEAARVAIEDLTWDSTGTGSVKIQGKGRKVRLCPLWKKTMSELQHLIRGRDAADPLFLNRYGDAMTRFGIHAVAARHTAAAAEKLSSLKTKRIDPLLQRLGNPFL